MRVVAIETNRTRVKASMTMVRKKLMRMKETKRVNMNMMRGAQTRSASRISLKSNLSENKLNILA